MKVFPKQRNVTLILILIRNFIKKKKWLRSTVSTLFQNNFQFYSKKKKKCPDKQKF